MIKVDGINNCNVEFYPEASELIINAGKNNKKIVLKQFPFNSIASEIIPILVQAAISQVWNQQELQEIFNELKKTPIRNPNALDKRVKQIFFNGLSLKNLSEDSEEEYIERDFQDYLVYFQKKTPIPAASMTIICEDQNIKGAALIQIVHEVVQSQYKLIVDLACEYEKKLEEEIFVWPEEKNGILSIQEPEHWILSLGGWKGMMPSQEIKNYFWYHLGSEQEKKKRFSGVEVYQNGVIFSIKDHRIYLPEDFSIGGINITQFWDRRQEQLVTKRDLSYPRVVSAIETIKKIFKLDDSKIARLQLCALSRRMSSSIWLQIPTKNWREVLQFLDYLNGLMFGVEASGLNAALVIGLMTLDLIVDGLFSYQAAFYVNGEGGVYPYACFGQNEGTHSIGQNEGTYSRREELLFREDHLFGNRESSKCINMKILRKAPELSPVAIKEATLIKGWLKYNGVILGIPHAVQMVAIEGAIQDLMTYYFFPGVGKSRVLEKFSKS